VVAEEREAASRVRHREHLQEEAAEQTRQHANGEEEGSTARDPALAIRRDAATRHDHVHVWMVGERRAPSVEHGGDADAGAQVLGVGGDGEGGLGRRLEQEIVDHGLVVVGDIGDRTRQGKHHVEVGHGQQFGARSASHCFAAAPWHFGQCRLRQEL